MAYPRFRLALCSLAAVALTLAQAFNGQAAEPGRSGPQPAFAPRMPSSPPKAPEFRLEPLAFSSLTGWAGDDHLAAFRTFLKSCRRLTRQAAAAAAEGKAPPNARLVANCLSAATVSRIDGPGARAFFETRFRPHRVVHAGPPGLLTGYYEPLLQGSRTPTERFKVPVYRRPPDLVNVVEESRRGATGDALTHVRLTATGREPYFTRAEIEQGALAGQGLELIWLADPVEAFFLQVQGSGRIQFADGDTIRIAYDGKNGHPYTSVGRALIEQGAMTAEQMSLQSLGKWLRADPERGRQAMWANKSFVFFRELDGAEAGAPVGALETPLTPGRSLAVDTAYHALGTPIWVSSTELTHAAKPSGGVAGFHRLMIAQDVGSAIRGPERGDIYFGSGSRAGRLAGITKHPGNFVVLLPVATGEFAGHDAAAIRQVSR